MIPTVITPILFGGADDKTVFAVCIAFLIVGMLSWIAGFFYDGLKYKKWTYRNATDNMSKFFGALAVICAIAFVLLYKLIHFIMTLL